MTQGIDGVDFYVNDVLGYSDKWQAHMTMLRELFQRVRDAGLTIRPTKTKTGFSKVDFVKHIVSAGAVAMNPEKLTQIQETPRPKTKRQVRAFLGLVGYYRKFVPNFAERAVPLTDLTKKGQPNVVQWGPAQEQAFRQLREVLAKAPILRLPDLSKPFIVQSDASDTGVGAALLQEHPDGVFPVLYASKKLLPRERRYSVIERECLAIVFAIKKFEKYLYGRKFTIQTDHQPLAHMHQAKIENSRIMRWALFLQNHQFRIEAIKGSQNVGADFLSRLE